MEDQQEVENVRHQCHPFPHSLQLMELRGSTERLWRGYVWCTRILYLSWVSPPLLSGLFRTGFPKEIWWNISRRSPGRIDLDL